MPNIEHDLQAIMDARYGREVRQSIHDAISDINNVADNAESVAITSQESAQANAILAESYAVGGTGSRIGEDTDNAKHYKEEAERIAGVYAVEDNLTSTSTIHSLSANQGRVLNGKVNTINNKIGTANGIATLDGTGRIPYSQLPESAMEFKGTWNASLNQPPITQGVGDPGDFYVVAFAGTWESIDFFENDQIIFDGESESWVRLPASDVRSVNGQSGEVELTAEDIPVVSQTVRNLGVDETDGALELIASSLEGGTTGQVLAKNSNSGFDFTWQSLTVTPSAIIDLIYPVGITIITENSANPSTYWPGTTWVRKAKGRVLIGVDENDTDFDTVGETGGSKTVTPSGTVAKHTLTINEMPNHKHITNHDGKQMWGNFAPIGETGWLNNPTNTAYNYNRVKDGFIMNNTGGGQGHDHGFTGTAHTNLQPYETVYYWKRTA